MDVKSFIFLSLFSLLILYINPFVEGDALYGLCANPDCSIPISKGITILSYNSPDDNRISVQPNEEVQIYVKDYGPKKDLWGVIVRGNRGYISKSFIRENALFVKELVTAVFEFKTLNQATDSHTFDSHLHTSLHPFQSDVVSDTVQHTHASDYKLMSSLPSSLQQQNLINSAPNGFPQHSIIDLAPQQQNLINLAPNGFPQHSVMDLAPQQQNLINSAPNGFPEHSIMNLASQQQNLINSASNDFPQQNNIMGLTPQQQNFISSLPENFQPQNNFIDLASQQQNSINSISDSFQQKQDFLNTVPSGIQPEQNRHDGNEVYNSPYSINPSSNLHLQHQLHQSSQFPIVSQQSSHFHMQSENVLNTGIQSQDILPSSTHPPYVYSPSHQHFSKDPAMASSLLYENSLSNMHTSSGYEHFDLDVTPTGQSLQNSHQHPPSEELHTIQSLHVQGLHSSLQSNDYIDNDLSKTFAMLSSRGFENSDMYANQEVQTNPSSQNTKQNLEFNSEELNSVSSQSQSPSYEISDTVLHSSIDPTLQLNGNKIVNSNNLETFSNGILSKNFNNVSFENLNSEQHIKAEEFVMINKDNSIEENEESEELSEENIDDLDDNEEDEVNDEESDSSDELISSSKTIAHLIDSQHDQSLSSSQMNLQASEGILEFQGSLKDPIHDSSTANRISKEHPSVIQREPSEILSSKSSFDNNAVLEETKFSVNTHSILESNIAESITDRKTESVDNLLHNSLDESVDNLNAINPTGSNLDIPPEKQIENLSENLDSKNNDDLTTESSIYKKEHTTPKISDFLMENDKRAEIEQILSPMDIDRLGEELTTYQGRNLKGEYGTTDDPLSESEVGNDENNTQSESDSYSSNGNWFDALKAAIDSIISWIPEPLYSIIMDLQKKGISPRVPVFTTLCGFTCIFLIVPLLYLKDRSKENRLSALLADAEKKAYTFSATSIVLQEKLETVQTEVDNLQASLAEEKSVSENLRIEFENQAEEIENAKAELESCLEVIDALKEKENEYLTLINDHEKEKEYYAEHKESLDKIMKEQENSIENLTSQLQESENKVQELEKEKEQFLLMKTDYEDKLAQFDRNCNQLLQEAEVWNMRVKELTENVNSEVAIKEELVASLKAKEEEIESLKELVETFKIFDEIEDPEEQVKTKEEKLQTLLNSIMIINQLKKEEQKSKLLDEQLQQEKNKMLDVEVELLDAKSEIDKLKLNYNQALQDKAEAQTKLEVLTNYFKDKEIQLQRQLGAQEADRQKKEENVNSAERRIMLIEQENASYKSQVASMKQEMEETERTLRSQIASQEKKAHENWIAARAAERNLENMKQEVTQLRQRLTLLEREQENWVNTSRDEIIRPVPKRIPGLNEESGNQETSERGMFPPPPLHDRLPLPPMILPPDRPLPPLPPPPMPPMFLPPPPPHMERHFGPQPWHIPPDHGSDYRTTPPEFMGGRELTPPRGRLTTVDGDTVPNTSSPMTTDTRDSRNSTPPHLLPDFHDIPPQPGRPYFPPPGGRLRFPMHPPYRRGPGPEPRKLDNQNESNSRGSQQPPAPEQWQHSRV